MATRHIPHHNRIPESHYSAAAEPAAALHGHSGPGYGGPAEAAGGHSTSGGCRGQDSEGETAGGVHQGPGQLPEDPARGHRQGEAEAGGRQAGLGNLCPPRTRREPAESESDSDDAGGGGQTEGPGRERASYETARVRHH